MISCRDVDRYPSAYAALRTRAPVHRSRLFQGWVFTRHADVSAILCDHQRFGSDPRKGNIPALLRTMLPPPEDYTMVMLDPPDHTRVRALARKAFTPWASAEIEPRIRSNLATLLDENEDPSAFDLLESVARPLAVGVIADMLGVPPEDRATFADWAAKGARLLEPTIGIRERRAGIVVAQDFDAYFRRIILERRASPGDDIVSALLSAQHQEARLSDRETLNMLRGLLAAGPVTTVNLLGNGFLALLRHPEQLERLRAHPELIPGAVEELLRFDSPVQTDFRFVLADCEVDGQALRQGECVALFLGAANRDPAVFEDPDRLDVGRRASTHLSFGSGIHHCLGAPLAQLQARIVLDTLLERFRSIKLAEHRPRFRPGVVLRGLESLPVRCVPA